MAIDFPSTPSTGQTLTSGNQVWTYDGVAWKSSYASAGYVQQSFTATAGQTSFTITGGYAAPFISVFQNGVRLVNGTDVTVTSGTAVVLAVGATAGDVIDVLGWAQIAIDASSTVSSISSNTTAVKDVTYILGASPFTLTLPASPSVGDSIKVFNTTSTGWTIARNGNLLQGLAENLTVDVQYSVLTVTYLDATNGWRIF